MRAAVPGPRPRSGPRRPAADPVDPPQRDRVRVDRDQRCRDPVETAARTGGRRGAVPGLGCARRVTRRARCRHRALPRPVPRGVRPAGQSGLRRLAASRGRGTRARVGLGPASPRRAPGGERRCRPGRAAGSALARARPVARARPPRAHPAPGVARRQSGRARAVPGLRACPQRRAGGGAAPGDDGRLRAGLRRRACSTHNGRAARVAGIGSSGGRHRRPAVGRATSRDRSAA